MQQSPRTLNVLALQLGRSRKILRIASPSVARPTKPLYQLLLHLISDFQATWKWCGAKNYIITISAGLVSRRINIPTWSARRENSTSLIIPASSWRLQVYQPIQGAWSRNQLPCHCISQPTIQWARPEWSYMSILITWFHRTNSMIEYKINLDKPELFCFEHIVWSHQSFLHWTEDFNKWEG